METKGPSLVYTTTVYTSSSDITIAVVRYIPSHILPVAQRLSGPKTGRRYKPRQYRQTKKTRQTSPLSRYSFTCEEEVHWPGT